MRIRKSLGHRHADLILKGAFGGEWQDIQQVIADTDVPLREAEPFTDRGRPLRPKRQQKGGSKRNTYALMPIDQDALNKRLHMGFERFGWEPQPLVLGRTLGRELESFLKGDFKKRDVFVEVEFGNTASLFRDLFKFQLVGQSKRGEVAVAVLPTSTAARLMDSNVATFERLESLMPFLDLVVGIPVLAIGVEPDSWDPIRERYEAMLAVAVANHVKCYTFDEASRIPNEAEDIEIALADKTAD